MVNIKKLTKNRQELLLQIIKDGIWKTENKLVFAKAREAKRVLILECQPVVAKVAKHYEGRKGLQFEKLMDLGNKGLETAVFKWIEGEIVRKYRFIIYATWFIRAEIHKKLGLPLESKNIKY